ncbi:MAG: hypothetical protein RL536_343 [Candidatus Parcubacteria bacterium]
MPAKGHKKGDILISYFTEPFTLFPWKPFPNYHSMYWECFQIASLFRERGYSVDIINSKDHTFIPRKHYKACIDAEDDLERLSKYLSKDCKKIFYVLISYWEAYNEAEQKRLNGLEKRRGALLMPRRRVRPSKSAYLADYLVGFGNRTVFDTFRKFNKPVFLIKASEVVQYNFPENKDWEKACKHFLWIGGGGAVLKGLDLVLEAFAGLPSLHLHVCGPIYGEKDFTDEYKKELEETPNVHVYGRLDVGGEKFAEILEKCASVIYPSGGDGTAGAIIQAMHAGLVPIITPETGIQENAGYILIENPTTESVRQAVLNFAIMQPNVIKSKSRSIWQYARSFYTKENFLKSYAKFIDEILKL